MIFYSKSSMKEFGSKKSSKFKTNKYSEDFESKNIKIQMRIQNDFGFFLKKLTWLLLLASPSLHLRSNIRPAWCPLYPTPLPTMFSISLLEVFQSLELFPKMRYANTYLCTYIYPRILVGSHDDFALFTENSKSV